MSICLDDSPYVLHNKESDSAVVAVVDALEPGKPVPQLLLYRYTEREGIRIRFLDTLARQLELELDLYLPHFTKKSARYKYVSANKLASQRTVLHLWGRSTLTAQICKNANAPKWSLGKYPLSICNACIMDDIV
jgi:hypothetical protein